MASKLITFDSEKNSFLFGGNDFTPDQVGAKLVDSLMQGSNQVDFGRVIVTVDYVTSMLRFLKKEGWFWDSFDVQTDHEFNPNRPTPGMYWGKIQEMRKRAAFLRDYVRRAAFAHVDSSAEQAEAERLEVQARDLLKPVVD